MNGKFSVQGRAETLRELATEELDLLVIGGGITGAGILLDAVTRGLRAGLIEMQDFAAGTSSRSTKLVHGGLRYLKQFEIGLVAEVGKERAIVYENGPHITTPLWMMLPIVEGGTYGRFSTWMGLTLYDYLAGVKPSERRRMLTRDEALAKEPLLRREGLRGAGFYVEYRTDDARLTLEILKEAVDRGGLAVNYTKAERLLNKNGRVAGVLARDMLTGAEYECFARKVVNAAGPWVDMLREMDGSKTGKTLHHTKGVHIVVDGSRFPLRNAVYFDVPDGRMVFAIPRAGKTYIGTTDTDYQGDLAHPRITTADMEYLVRCVNAMFPDVRLTAADVESGWAGIRPLIHEEGKSPSEISRRDEIFHSPSGLITIAGGKLTGYRKMADKVVSLVAKELEAETGRQFMPCTTHHVAYSGGKFSGSDNYEPFVAEKTKEGVALGLTSAAAEKLARRYGTNVDLVFGVIRDRAAEAEAFGLPLDVFASLVYGVEHEMVMTPADHFIRRTGDMYFNIHAVQQWKTNVTAWMAAEFGWTEDELAHWRADLEAHIAEATQTV
jgi:glycerol-3-phosphate dehydrogenase